MKFYHLFAPCWCSRFTQRNLLRIYPKGTRIGSSNYNPLVGWMHGAQMVALNMQDTNECDYPLITRVIREAILRISINWTWKASEGMFRANGGYGFVKKPDLFLNTDFDPREALPIKTTLQVRTNISGGRMAFRFPPYTLIYVHRQTSIQGRYISQTQLEVRFICAAVLGLTDMPDFVLFSGWSDQVGIAGVPADTRMMETTAIEDQWIPVWDEVFIFPLTVPEQALLRIEVMEYDTSKKHDFGGQTCLPLSELRTGIRCVPLHDQKGERFKSVRLLMGFRFI
ncbi:unnamed protein product [Ilex paraguariensis]|uniref:Phosphoinositide phospholipase C n=1 Tax=Ilex paraguariensis TaxID=185542 RepID=A0ABC8QXP8_9AQUA